MSTHELYIQRARDDSNRRWWVIAGLLSLIIFLHPHQSVKEFWPVLAVIGISAVYNFILSLLAYHKIVSRYWLYAEIVVDLILISGLVHFTGGVVASPLFLLFPVFVLVQAFYEDPVEILISGTGVFISMAVLFAIEPRPEHYLWILLERALVITAITVAIGIKVRLVNRETNQVKYALAEKACQLENVNHVNKGLELKISTSTQQLEKANVMLVKKNLALMAFHEIYTAMSSTYNSSQLLNLVMDTAMSLLKANSGVLMLKESDSDILRVKVSRGLPARFLKTFQVKVGKDVEGEVAQTGKAMMFADLERNSKIHPINRESRSKMCVPLSIKKKNVGIITVESAAPNTFSRNDLELFNTLGSQASEVLQNLEIYDELKTKADHLSLLFEVGKNIGSIYNLRKLFEAILVRAVQVMKARRGFLMIYDKNADALKIRASIGLDTQVDQAAVSVEKGIAGNVYQKECSILIPNVKKSPMYDQENDHIYVGHDLLACPLVAIKKKVLGVICLNDRIGTKKFDTEDLDLLNALASQAAIAIENVELYASIRRDYLNAIKALAAAVDAKDHYTHGHSNKVMVYATMIAKTMGLSRNDIEKVKYGALLHDVGKIGISEAVLNKPSKLTPKEFDTIAMHPILGVSIVQNIESLKDLIPTILYHHERYSGGGYPEGKSGNSIPLGARIVAVGDAWDVMTSDRAYRKALPISVAVAELKKFSGTQFDPDIVEVFLEALEKDEKVETFRDEEQSGAFLDEEEISRLMN
ncbi:GAF domain-containing protein [bacterium]|nr:GAF domain-containing protein [bacterium]